MIWSLNFETSLPNRLISNDYSRHEHVSEVWRPTPDPAVLVWLRSQSADSLYLCTPVLAELRYGMERLALGRRKAILSAAIDELEAEGYRDRILPLDIAAATEFARLMVKRERAGRRMETMDALIGAIAVVHGAALLISS